MFSLLYTYLLMPVTCDFFSPLHIVVDLRVTCLLIQRYISLIQSTKGTPEIFLLLVKYGILATSQTISLLYLCSRYIYH